jgi:hypothetical protein
MAKRIDFAHTDRPDSARKFSCRIVDSASNLSRDQVQVTGGSDGAAGSPSVARHSNIYYNITTLGFALDLRNFWEPLSKKFV